MVISHLSLFLLTTPTAMAQMGELVQTWSTPQPYSESLAYDKINKRLLLSSLISNTIASVDPANDMALLTSYSTFGEDLNGAGIKVSEDGHVYAVFNQFTTQDLGGLAVVDLPVTDSEYAAATPYWGALNSPCTFLASNCGWANDIAIASDGTAYVTDSKNGRVMKAVDGTIEDFAVDPLLLWSNVYGPFGANGIVIDPRGFLVVSNTDKKSLVRIDLETKEVSDIPVEGGIPNLDGMAMDSKGRIVAIGQFPPTLYILKDNDDDWKSASVMGTIDVDGGVPGALTAFTFGEDETEGYVTYVNFPDLFTGDIKTTGSVGKVMLSYDDILTNAKATQEVEEATE